MNSEICDLHKTKSSGNALQRSDEQRNVTFIFCHIREFIVEKGMHFLMNLLRGTDRELV